MQTLIRISALIAVAVLSGCASASSVKLGSNSATFPPTDPATIEVYMSPPERAHIQVAMVDGTMEGESNNRTQTKALEAMKKEAARHGAHAIILTNKTGSTGGGVFVPAGSITMMIPTEKLTLSGIAVRFTTESSVTNMAGASSLATQPAQSGTH